MSTTANVPNLATIANAKDRLEQANFRMGKAQTAAIMSSAVARQDAERLEEITRERDAADLAYRDIVKALTEGTGHTSEANAENVRQRAEVVRYHTPSAPVTPEAKTFLFGNAGVSPKLETSAPNELAGDQHVDAPPARDPLVLTGVELQDFDRSAG